MLVWSLRVVAGLDEESSDVPCGVDVVDALALELEEAVDNPGTTIGTKFSVLHWVLLPCLVRCRFLPPAPTQRNIRVLRRVCLTTGLQACPRGSAPSRRAPGRERTLLLAHAFALLLWV